MVSMQSHFTRHTGSGTCQFCGKHSDDLTTITRNDSLKRYRVCDQPCSDTIRDTPAEFSRVINLLAP